MLLVKNIREKLFELDEKELENFSKDLAKVSAAINKVFSPNKINYAAYGDKVSHLHFHLVPKYEGGPRWGDVFEVTPKEKVILSDEEYQHMINKIKENL